LLSFGNGYVEPPEGTELLSGRSHRREHCKNQQHRQMCFLTKDSWEPAPV
jgi:hypothetical protein